MKTLSTFVLLVLLTGVVHASTPENVYDSTNTARQSMVVADSVVPRANWTVTLWNGPKIENVALDRVSGNKLFVRGREGEIPVDVQQIVHMHREKGTHFWTGAAIGAAAGLVIEGIFALRDDYRGYTGDRLVVEIPPAVTTLAFSIIGGLIGSGSSADTDFDFTLVEAPQKSLAAEKVIEFDRR